MPLLADRAVTVGSIGIAAAGNTVVVAQSAAAGDWTLGGVTAAITGIGFAVVGLVTYAIRQIGGARVETLRAWDEANKDSLTGQLRAANENAEHIRASLHALRNEMQAERARHAEEIERLTEQITLLHATNRSLHDEIARLNSRVKELTGATKAVVIATEEVRSALAASSDSIPTATAPPPPPPPPSGGPPK